jgi:hypothetical protein
MEQCANKNGKLPGGERGVLRLRCEWNEPAKPVSEMKGVAENYGITYQQKEELL